MKKKKKRNIPNWDLIQNKMTAFVEAQLQKRWKIPITLNIYEFSKELPIKNEQNYDGFVGFFTINKEIYIDYIAVRKRKNKEYNTFVIAHELGHILDFQEGGYDKRYLNNSFDKRIRWECEKRAFAKGYDLLKIVGMPVYYLEKYIGEFRSKSLEFLICQLGEKKNMNVCKDF